jgi:hypothetical protein
MLTVLPLAAGLALPATPAHADTDALNKFAAKALDPASIAHIEEGDVAGLTCDELQAAAILLHGIRKGQIDILKDLRKSKAHYNPNAKLRKGSLLRGATYGVAKSRLYEVTLNRIEFAGNALRTVGAEALGTRCAKAIHEAVVYRS